MTSEWKFRRREAQCRACGTAFQEGQRHASVLLIQAEDLSREDICLACWQERAADTDLFFWFTRHAAGRKRFELDLVTLEQLFVHLEGRSEEKVRELRYLLCLILMRKRRLKLERVQRNAASPSMVVRRPRQKETFEVSVFEFSPERIEELRRDLLQIFEGAEPGAWLDDPAGRADSAVAVPPAASGLSISALDATP